MIECLINCFMSSQLSTPNREAAIWARLIEAQKDLPPELAEYLTDEERAEFDSYLHVGNLLAVMQSKARRVLSRKPQPSS